jgi:hypothetical protein
MKNFSDYAAQQGWTPATQVVVLLRYIESQDSYDAFFDFLDEQCEEEDAA